MHTAILADLAKAEKFIYMEYFIVEEGKFWNSMLDILKEKAAAGIRIISESSLDEGNGTLSISKHQARGA